MATPDILAELSPSPEKGEEDSSLAPDKIRGGMAAHFP